MRRAMLVLLFLVAPIGAFAQTVDRINVVGRGIFVVETGTKVPNANTPTGTIAAVASVRRVKSTTNIQARPGVEFGFQYVVVGKPKGTDVALDVVNIYPPAGLRDPGKTEPMRESRYQLTKKIGETVYLGYGIENDWEAVPGIWTFQIWHNNRKLAEQRFTVTKGK